MGWRAAILAVAFLQTLAVRTPRIATEAREPILMLPPVMDAALTQFDPEFSPRRLADYPSWVQRDKSKISGTQAPFAVIGNFNGDRVLDVVIDGDNRVSGRRVVILSNGSGFRVVEVEREAHIGKRPAVVQAGLALVSPGTIRSSHEQNPLTLRTDAFEVQHYETSSKVIYYRDGVWHEYWTSD